MHTQPVASIRAVLAGADAEALPDLIACLAHDGRPGVTAAIDVARRRVARFESEMRRLEALEVVERGLAARGAVFVAGVDEVGRGALAGPVTAAACVLPVEFRVAGLTDSKRLGPDARVVLDHAIRARASAVSVAHVPAADIDALGIANATVLAMRLALRGLGMTVDHAVIDGRPVEVGIEATAIVRGDATVRAIAAASIVAKVARDALMVELDETHTGYGLALNKGYGTPEHLAVLTERGPSPIHRMSFSPCSQQQLF